MLFSLNTTKPFLSINYLTDVEIHMLGHLCNIFMINSYLIITYLYLTTQN